jgi:phosphocarrier protein
MPIEEKSRQQETYQVDLEVRNKMGIHARPAAMIVRVANKYPAEVYVEKDDEQVNGKSIMGLMMLAAGQGSVLKFTAIGPSAQQLLKELEALFERRFEES